MHGVGMGDRKGRGHGEGRPRNVPPAARVAGAPSRRPVWIVREPTAGGDKPRPYRPEFMPHGVGDGLVPSRFEFKRGRGSVRAVGLHDLGTGDDQRRDDQRRGDKPRPYTPLTDRI